MQLSRQDSAISVFKTTKRGTERVNLQELPSGIEHREVYSLFTLCLLSPFKAAKGKSVQSCGQWRRDSVAYVNSSHHSHCQGVREEETD